MGNYNALLNILLYFVLKEWITAIPGKCVKNNNIKVKECADLRACQVECEREAGCRSIDYGTGTNNCYLNNADRTSQDFTNCDSDTVYTEWYYL